MQCKEGFVFNSSLFLLVGGALYCLWQKRTFTPYGRYVETLTDKACLLPAKWAWFVQELPSFLVPVLLILTSGTGLHTLGTKLVFFMFCGHYFQRTFIYSSLTRGRPSPLKIVISAVIFCSFNGYLQGHYMIYCANYVNSWLTDMRFISGVTIFIAGMAINIHSDHILRSLRKPGEVAYRIPQGGLFEYVSGANFFGEIIEWFGYAIATWSLPAFSFAFFTLCSIGPRAYHHHKYYLKNIKDYPKTRKALIPFIF
ncbi:3-oxo-5-alpha-steroid 4-dehydrogenase 2 [Latimeria chalumnae]|uniref:3-oxo-5-alpha-steroid 4-dehydrogenase n=2 Tax=Latimeria TaxID=7896 RepID=M3XLC4_LATCH|nr:PREDICTED: 3-oxo-5-alpha-steroid 4-dehydrogenase 2 [Latimeria chalumnae]CCP19144.1 5 alpha-reductase 2 [Latimeria menadoensis]|eukprot:XP_005992881.1 PREDICTED: 3-oxo-5-alpha-steroid 4-dehydrogenase 2 [Latimeria chalumnae]